MNSNRFLTVGIGRDTGMGDAGGVTKITVSSLRAPDCWGVLSCSEFESVQFLSRAFVRLYGLSRLILREF